MMNSGNISQCHFEPRWDEVRCEVQWSTVYTAVGVSTKTIIEVLIAAAVREPVQRPSAGLLPEPDLLAKRLLN